MGRALPAVLLLALTVFAFIDALMTPREQLPGKGWWLLAIVFLPLVGPGAWLLIGRRASRSPGQAGGGVGRPPVAPDDDEDFLRGL